MPQPVLPPRTLAQSTLAGGLGFGLASVAVFATVAFGEGWMYQRLGVAGAYVVWTVLFVLLGGLALAPLAPPAAGGRLRFLGMFGLAFLAYAAGWVAAYFTLGGAVGEWVGSLGGSLLLAFVLAAGLGVPRSAPRMAVLLFVANSAGYFLGSMLYQGIGGRAGMILWGAVYGLCLGAGLGAALHLARRAPA
jgi:hypothetical protein